MMMLELGCDVKFEIKIAKHSLHVSACKFYKVLILQHFILIFPPKMIPNETVIRVSACECYLLTVAIFLNFPYTIFSLDFSVYFVSTEIIR